ncbi:hypothetical protein L7F22_037741, partial [Adiantum nelumboides]|nr:hypothetical protein [Adiantum nelumboides]
MEAQAIEKGDLAPMVLDRGGGANNFTCPMDAHAIEKGDLAPMVMDNRGGAEG